MNKRSTRVVAKKSFLVFLTQKTQHKPQAHATIPEHGQLSVGVLRNRDEHLAKAETDRRDSGSVRRTSRRTREGKNQVRAKKAAAVTSHLIGIRSKRVLIVVAQRLECWLTNHEVLGSSTTSFLSSPL